MLYIMYRDADGNREFVYKGEAALANTLKYIAGCAYAHKRAYDVTAFCAQFSDNYSVDEKQQRQALKIAKRHGEYLSLTHEVERFSARANDATAEGEPDEPKRIFSKCLFTVTEEVERQETRFITRDDFTFSGYCDLHRLIGRATITPDYYQTVFPEEFALFKKIYDMDVVDAMARRLSGVCSSYDPQKHTDAIIEFNGNPMKCYCHIFSYNPLFVPEEAVFQSFGMEEAHDPDLLFAITSATLCRFLVYINRYKTHRWDIAEFDPEREQIGVILEAFPLQEKPRDLRSWV